MEADAGTPGTGATAAGTAPAVGRLWVVYTLGRVLIAAALVALLWVAGLGKVGLGFFPPLVFGLLLSVPVSYLALRSVRDRLTLALAVRGEARKAARAAFRERLQGTDPD